MSGLSVVEGLIKDVVYKKGMKNSVKLKAIKTILKFKEQKECEKE